MADVTITSTTWTKDADLEKQKSEIIKKKHSLRSTLLLGFAACGCIFGDIGTSPLYVYSSTFTQGPPTERDVLGAMSVIFWSLTLLVVVKYLGIVLCADDEGEGGTFALYSLLCRYAGITPANAGPPDASDLQLSRYSSHRDATKRRGIAQPISKAISQLFTKHAWARGVLLCVVLLMTSMVMGDGVLTPAQSVLGAIYGLQVKTSISQGAIVGISVAIVVLIFAAQPLGTGRVSSAFSPIVLIYFMLNLIVACTNIHRYDPAIFRALSPHWIYYWFRDNKHLGWQQMAGLFLSITGAEALYADLGHFNKAAVRGSFLLVAYPALIITYLGQAAWLMRFPEQVSSTFYASIPFGDGFYWVVFLFATAAACIASQAMISAVFSVVKQSVALGCFPHLTIRHMSEKAMGSIYIPEVNFIMMVLTIIVVAVFKTTTKLGLAYGVAVSMMMLGTDFLMCICMLLVWQTNVVLVVGFLLFFGLFDGVYVSANLEKVPTGGWFALMIAGLVFIPSALWWLGTHTKRQHLNAKQVQLKDLIALSPRKEEEGEPHDDTILDANTRERLLRLPSVALMYCDTLTGAPPVMQELVKRWGGLHKLLVLITVRFVPVTKVSEEERFLVARLPYNGVYRCVLRYGYHDRVDHSHAFVAALLNKVTAGETDPAVLKLASEAAPTNISYVLSSSWIISTAVTGLGVLNRPMTWLKQLTFDWGYTNMQRIARKNWELWHVPVGGLFEVGHPVEA